MHNGSIALVALGALLAGSASAAAPDLAGPPSSTAAEARFAALVARAGLSGRRKAAEEAFPKTAAGATLARVATLYRRASLRLEDEDSRAVFQDLDRLRAEPERALGALRLGLGRLPPGLERERQFLLQFSARLPVAQAARVDLLVDQLHRSPSRRDAPLAVFTSAVAVELLAPLLPDRARVRQIVGDAVAARDELTWRRLLIAALARTDPAGAAALGHKHRLDDTFISAPASVKAGFDVGQGRFAASVDVTAAGHRVRLGSRRAHRVQTFRGLFRATRPEGKPRSWVQVHDPWFDSLEWHALARLTERPARVLATNPRRAIARGRPAIIRVTQTIDLSPAAGGPIAAVAPGGGRYLEYFTSGESEHPASEAGPDEDLELQGADDSAADRIATGWAFTQGMSIELLDGVPWSISD